ncbi:MAG: hypothetical protein ACQR33_04150 [Candidatus Saccharibacteria bacterium]
MTSVEQIVATDIAAYCAAMRKTIVSYDPRLAQATERFLQELEHGDYLTAQLVVTGYYLCGGTDTEMIVIAARALQMTHVYARLSSRGTQPQYAALHGMHAAHILLANLTAAPESLRIKVLSITNRALLLYMRGSTQRKQGGAMAVLPEALLDCFATELTLNPLHVGMVLADADCAATDAITPFAMCAGKARLTVADSELSDRYWRQAEAALGECRLWKFEALQPICNLLKHS